MSDVQKTTVQRDTLRLTQPGCCYVCAGRIGVFTWTDSNGKAHPWCIPSEAPKWKAAKA